MVGSAEWQFFCAAEYVAAKVGIALFFSAAWMVFMEAKDA